jgi:hypothetical protein
MDATTPSRYGLTKPGSTCHATGRELSPGEAIFSALVEAEDAAASVLGLKRVDVAAEAWDQGHRPEGLFSYWKTTLPEPTAKRRVFVDDAVLMNLVERLDGEADPQRQAFRYVVALILMRKKLLRFDGTRKQAAADAAQADEDADTPGGDRLTWWQFTPKKDITKGRLGRWDEGRTLEVLDPRLDEAAIAEVTEQLGEVLEAEL